MASKAEEAKADGRNAETEALPAYEVEAGEQSSISPPPATREPIQATGKSVGPTQDSPFNFPSDAPPSYAASSSSSSSTKKPVAIPQTHPDPAAPFIDAYAPQLLQRGITPEAWRSFLQTLSAFLTAKVSDRAISHAGDVAKQIGERPKSVLKGIANHAKKVGTNIGNNAKRGNIIGATMGAIGGLISIPIAAAAGTASAALQLPASTVMAVARKPQTPRERAAAYAAVANRDWFQPRGLEARILDTEELCQVLGVPSSLLMEPGKLETETAKGKLGRLSEHIASLDTAEPESFELTSKTLWIILTEVHDGSY